MSAIIGHSQLDFLANKFLVVLPEIRAVSRFETFSGLKAMSGIAEIRSGGSSLARKIPNGIIEIPNVTLTRGSVLGDEDLYTKFKRVANLADQRQNIPSNLIFERAQLVQTDRNAQPLKQWTMYDCWPCEFEAGEYDAKAGEALVEKITFCLNRWEPSDTLSGLDLISLVTDL